MKATYYEELAAIMGSTIARYNLGGLAEKAGNMDRAIKHHMIAIRCGNDVFYETIV
jgi:hypothetical protein